MKCDTILIIYSILCENCENCSESIEFCLIFYKMTLALSDQPYPRQALLQPPPGAGVGLSSTAAGVLLFLLPSLDNPVGSELLRGSTLWVSTRLLPV